MLFSSSMLNRRGAVSTRGCSSGLSIPWSAFAGIPVAEPIVRRLFRLVRLGHGSRQRVLGRSERGLRLREALHRERLALRMLTCRHLASDERTPPGEYTQAPRRQPSAAVGPHAGRRQPIAGAGRSRISTTATAEQHQPRRRPEPICAPRPEGGC